MNIKGKIVVTGTITVSEGINVTSIYDIPLSDYAVENIVRTHGKLDEAAIVVKPWGEVYRINSHGLEVYDPKINPRKEVYRYSLRGLNISPESVQFINDLLKPW